jgi:hypothetical protein
MEGSRPSIHLQGGGEIKLGEDSIPPLFKPDEHKVRTGNDIIFKPEISGLCNCSMYILTVDLLRRFLYIVWGRIFFFTQSLRLHME